MISLRKITVISFLAFFLLLGVSAGIAGEVATITHLSGPVAVRKADGSSRAISIGSKVEEGDTVVTEKRTYARLKFSDGAELTLKPNSQFQVEKYRFDQEKPVEDSALFNLVKGGLRTVTGQIGKRGNPDSYQMKTLTAVCGVRGTIYDAHFCVGNSCGSIAPGFYLAVTEGSVVVTNSGANPAILQVKPGQYVYVQNPNTPPVVLPAKPNIPFNPPPSVGASAAAAKIPGGQPAAPSCEVR